MKHLLLPALFLLFTGLANCQYSRIIVQLKDKGNNTFSLSNPSQFLSPKAIQRRTRYNIPLDSTDLPVSESYINTIKAVNNVTVLSVSKWLNRVLIRTTDPAAISTIQSLPFVVYTNNVAPRISGQNTPKVKFNEDVKPLAETGLGANKVTADVYNYGNNYNQVHIHEGEFLHNKGFTGSGIQITVLDAGFSNYKTITAFDSIRLNGQVLGERDYVNYDNSVNEDDSHGMYCLSTMAANWPGRMIGTAPKANYFLVRTEDAPNEYPVEEHNWVVGAEFADSVGSDMISSSLGYNTFDAPIFDHTYSDFYKNTATASRGASLAAKKGMIVMNSAGNEGNNSWKYIIFPADSDSVCAVGAVNSQGGIASFSSRGYAGKTKPNIVSVGVATVIAGQNNLPSSGNGTSFANPNVAGLVACLWQAFPALNNMQLLKYVYQSANKYTSPDSAYGFGLPNFKKAYRLIKHDQNVILYGNDWMWATPDPFDTVINARFIGRVDGNVKLYLKNAAGQVISQVNFSTEQEEVYAHVFQNLGPLPSGYYTIQYTDTTTFTRSITVQKGTIFPLNLISFSGALQNGEAQIKWVAENEQGVNRYKLQRSEDGMNYTTIYEINPRYGAGQNTYVFNDKTPLAEGYYRLNSINFDNSFSLSNVVKLKLPVNQLTIKYNNSSSLLGIRTSISSPDKLIVQVFGIDGKKVFQKEKALYPVNDDTNISLTNLARGVYIVTAETSAEKKSLKVKR